MSFDRETLPLYIGAFGAFFMFALAILSRVVIRPLKECVLVVVTYIGIRLGAALLIVGCIYLKCFLE